MKPEITRIWQLQKEGNTPAEIAEATATSVGHVRRRVRFKSDFDRGEVLNLNADESRKKYGSADLAGLHALAREFKARSFQSEFHASLRENGLSAHVNSLIEHRRTLIDATDIPRPSLLLIPSERFWGAPWKRFPLDSTPEVNPNDIASFKMMLQHLQRAGVIADYERLRTSLAGLGAAALRFADDVSGNVKRKVDFTGWPTLAQNAISRIDQLVRVITWDMEERAANRSAISGMVQKGYSAQNEPYWSPFGAFPFECPSEKDAIDMLEIVSGLRNRVDRSQSRTHLKTALDHATKDAAKLRTTIEPIDRFENMLRRGFCFDCPKEPI